MQTHIHYTRCPQCHTAFKVTEKMLAMAHGKVRCGACLQVFQATDFLLQPRVEPQPTVPISEPVQQRASQPAPAEEMIDSLFESESESESESTAVAEHQAENFEETEVVSSEADTLHEASPNLTANSENYQEPEIGDMEAVTAEPEEPLTTEWPQETAADEQILVEESLPAEAPEWGRESEVFEDEAQQSAEPHWDFDEADVSHTAELELDEDFISAIESKPQVEAEPEWSESNELESNELESSEFETNEIDSSELDVNEFDSSDMELTEPDISAPFEEVDEVTYDVQELAYQQDAPLENIEHDEMELLADNLTEQIKESATEPDPLEEFEGRVERKKTGLRTLVIASASLILLVLLGNNFWQNRQTLAWDDTWGGMTKSLCNLLPCDLKPRRDVSKILLRQRIVTPSETQENYLDIKILLTNEASFAQPYPRITIKFSNSLGEPVAEQHFAVADYFPEKQSQLMPAGSEVHIAFSTKLPHPDALGFEFSFD